MIDDKNTGKFQDKMLVVTLWRFQINEQELTRYFLRKQLENKGIIQ